MLKIRHSLDSKRVNPQTVDWLPLQKPPLTIPSPITIPYLTPPTFASKLTPPKPTPNLLLFSNHSPHCLLGSACILAPSKTHP